ncbi:MAG: DUF4197 domain-containing protein [Flavobacteriales bacterium]
MKNYVHFIALSLLITQVSCAQKIKALAKDLPISLPTTPVAKPQLTNEEVVAGLKEALQLGIEKAVNKSCVLDGFLGNPQIRLPFPPDAIQVKEKALQLGMNTQVDKFETTLNRAAEEAVKEALPIFKDAILQLSVQDGFKILNGGQGAATAYLKQQTQNALYNAFLPKVKAATANVGLTAYWNPIITKYNAAVKLTGGQQLNPDLDAYITQRAIEGLFILVSKEEDQIRANPAARVSDLLAKVFGSI